MQDISLSSIEYIQVAGDCGLFLNANLTSTGELMYTWNNGKKRKAEVDLEKESCFSHFNKDLLSFSWIIVAFLTG